MCIRDSGGTIDGVKLVKLLRRRLIGQLDLGRSIVIKLKSTGKADLMLNLVGAIGVFAQERLGGLATVAEFVLAIGKPGAHLLANAALDSLSLIHI